MCGMGKGGKDSKNGSSKGSAVGTAEKFFLDCIYSTIAQRALKQASRKLERKWRHTKLEVFRLAWKDSTVQYRRALAAVRSSYFSNLIEENKNNPKFVFDTVAKLTTKQHSPREDGFHLSSNKFMNFFE